MMDDHNLVWSSESGGSRELPKEFQLKLLDYSITDAESLTMKSLDFVNKI